ncbi:MAG: cytidine deaminase [Bacteroidota bacterium]
MKKIELKAYFDHYVDENELSEEDAHLLKQAKEALKDAYAPYSNFQVGAAALLENGEVFLGNNQENAAYPLGMCGERVALFAASAIFPNVPIKAIAIVAQSNSQVLKVPASPCGSCRQTIFEKEFRQKQPIRIILQGETGPVYIIHSIKDILPLSFDADFL